MNYSYFQKAILILFLWTSHTINVNAQIRSFPNHPSEYPEALQRHIEGKDRKGTRIFFETKFTPFWNSRTESEQVKIVHVSNELLNRRALADPHFNTFAQILVSFYERPDKLDYLNLWLTTMEHYCGQRRTTLNAINAYMQSTLHLIKDNKVFLSSTVEWAVEGDDFEYEFNGEQVSILFGKTDLKVYSRGDSSVIYGTIGRYFPFDRKWHGAGGKITWERAGFAPEQVYAVFNQYELDMTRSYYDVDSATFVNTRYFDYPLIGKVSEKVLANVDTSSALYPLFMSYSKRYEIKNIFPGIDYEGGFTMKGARFVGEGSDEDKAILYFYRKDTIFFTAASKSYSFRDDRVAGFNTAVTFRLDTDSIYHPGLNFRYYVDKQEMWLIRTKEGMGRAPYIDTYHQLELDFTLLTWNINEPRITFLELPGEDIKKANFESMDYFTHGRFEQLQGMDEQNPLMVLRNYSIRNGGRYFNEKQFAGYIRASMPQTRQYLLTLSYQHFIDYDLETGDIFVRDKTFNYVNCSLGRKDYDIITFVSNVMGTDHNAVLSLLDFNIRMKGVQEISLSDVHSVTIFPEDQEITVKRNRNVSFNGRVLAGLFLFKGSNFDFDYENFKIKLTDVDEVRMRVKTGQYDSYGVAVEENVRSVIKNMSGEVIIDDINNKSGTKDLPEYPILHSFRDSYVYYDDRNIFNGVYNKNDFYFQIYPFSKESLDKLTRRSLVFGGHFVSAGIFPPFDDSLSVQNDYSLGFKRLTPENGYPAYGGKGTYKNEIFLSNRGLRGKGELDFLACHTESDDYIFFPDSMTTTAKLVEIKTQDKGTEYPPVKGTNIFIKWLPYKDRMELKNTTRPFDMFEGQATLDGMLAVEPTGLTGSGKMDFLNAELFSEEFKFKTHTIDADTSNFNLKGYGTEGFTFKTSNVNAHIDFTKRLGEFQSNGEASFVEFPINQYICFMDQFTWHMDDEEIEMSASRKALDTQQKDMANLSPTQQEDIQLQGSQFISIHPAQDSLDFIAPSAKYNLRRNIISAKDVRLIRVADATVYPADGNVVIERRAVMQTLSNSKIIANNTNRYHTIYDCNTNVYGKNSYTSSGKYDYVDEAEQTQTIYFSVVGVDSTFQTYATGDIGITDGFTLSPNFGYTGKAILHASREHLQFEGATRLSHECDAMNRYWIKFKSIIDPNDIHIPIGDTLRDINNVRSHASFNITNDSTHIYPAFLTHHKNYSDIPIVKSKGYLTYDHSDGKYKISDKDKLIEFNLPGNYLSLHKTACVMYGEGDMNLGVDVGRMESTQVGSLNMDLISGNMFIEMIFGLKFFILSNSMDVMAKEINSSVGLEAVDISRPIFEKGLAHILGRERANELLTEFSIGRMRRMPRELEHTILLNDLTLKWYPAYRSYISDGPIGIGVIGNEYINRKVDGYVEIQKKRSGDRVTLYLELDEKTWYFFSYTRNVMQVASSNEAFMTPIRELKADKRRQPTERGQKPFSYYPVAQSIKNRFLKNINSIFEGLEIEEEEEERGRRGRRDDDDGNDTDE